MAKFKINSTFKLTLREQHVLLGDIIEGEIGPGDLIQISIDDDQSNIKIKSVEYVDEISNRRTQIGLLLESLNEATVERLKIIVGQTVTIIKASCN
jgi:hypothetical protein